MNCLEKIEVNLICSGLDKCHSMRETIQKDKNILFCKLQELNQIETELIELEASYYGRLRELLNNSTKD